MTQSKLRISPEDKLLADVCDLMDSASTSPWQKPWSGEGGPHRNLISAHQYRGTNPLLLELGMLMRESTIPLWIGSAQAKGQGWLPKKGSKAVRILQPNIHQSEVVDDAGKPQLDSDGEPMVSAWVSYKVIPVFNVNDIHGVTADSQADLDARITAALKQVETATDDKLRIHEAELIIDAWPVPINHGGTRACYSPSSDTITLPKPEAFTSRETYLATKLHEMVHSTGHSDRLNRPMGGGFGSDVYAYEELIAEFGSLLCCQRLRIGYELEHHASYLRNWSKRLREGGSKELLKVLSAARIAADEIIPESDTSE